MNKQLKAISILSAKHSKSFSFSHWNLLVQKMNLVVITGVIVNILCVVGVVICNKYITDVDGFNFMVFLSFLHFAFTALGTRVLLFFNVFTYQSASFLNILPLSIGSLLSVAFMNLNLSYNSVGFYQVLILIKLNFTFTQPYCIK